MINRTAIEVRLVEILNSDDQHKLYLIMEEIKNAYCKGFEYAWTQGKIIHTINQERMVRERRQYDNELRLRLDEFITEGKNYKNGNLLYIDPTLRTKYDWLRDQ